MQQHCKSQKNPLELLKTIKLALKNDASFESLSFNEKTIELKIAGEKTKTLMQCAEILAESPMQI